MGEPITAKRVYKALFTKEDGFNFHKFFGLFALLNFIYRFRFVGPSDMNFKTTGLATPVCFFMHAMLSASSLIFKIPIKRIAEGSRIWPEYRLHSIIFAYRSLACLLVTYLELKYGGETRYYLNGLIVVGTLLAADFGTWWVGPAGRSSTIQGLDAPPFMRYFFSVMQFHATAGCLIGVRRFSTQFFYVWIIQFTAFLMTLRRKNIAPHGPLVVTYGVMLTAGFLVSTHDHYTHGLWLSVQTLAHVAATLRLGVRLNKYVLWIGLAVLVHVGRPYLAVVEGEALGLRTAAWLASTACVAVIGKRKIDKDSAQAAKADAKAL